LENQYETYKLGTQKAWDSTEGVFRLLICEKFKSLVLRALVKNKNISLKNCVINL
jgi:hypothetical protein